MTSFIHLEAVWRFKQDQLEREILDFILEWNSNHMCSCCKNWKIGDKPLECNHIEQKKIKKFGERNIQQFKSILFLRSLSLKKQLHC